MDEENGSNEPVQQNEVCATEVGEQLQVEEKIIEEDQPPLNTNLEQETEESEMTVDTVEKNDCANGDNVKEDTMEEKEEIQQDGDDDEEADEEDDEEEDDDDDIQITINDIKDTPVSAPNTGYAPVNLNITKRGAGFAGTNASGVAVGTGAGAIAAGKGKVPGIDMDTPGTYNGQSILDLNLDSLEDKPWRKPGADITDYFNYGFSEDTWKMYCDRQRRLRTEADGERTPVASMNTNMVHTGNNIVLRSAPPTHRERDYHHHRETRETSVPAQNSVVPPSTPGPAGKGESGLLPSINENSKYATSPALGPKKAGPPPGRKTCGAIEVIGAGAAAVPQVISGPPPSVNMDSRMGRRVEHMHTNQFSMPPPPYGLPPTDGMGFGGPINEMMGFQNDFMAGNRFDMVPPNSNMEMMMEDDMMGYRNEEPDERSRDFSGYNRNNSMRNHSSRNDYSRDDGYNRGSRSNNSNYRQDSYEKERSSRDKDRDNNSNRKRDRERSDRDKRRKT